MLRNANSKPNTNEYIIALKTLRKCYKMTLNQTSINLIYISKNLINTSSMNSYSENKDEINLDKTFSSLHLLHKYSSTRFTSLDNFMVLIGMV